MDNNLSDIVKNRSDYKKQRDSKYKLESKERLSKILKKKIQTTMIGALSTLEEHLGFLWDNEESSEEDKQIMKDLYQKIRSEILDKGNNQARNIDAELSQYDVEWLKYSVKIPMILKKED